MDLVVQPPKVTDASTPKVLVAELDRFIVGQNAAKRAVRRNRHEHRRFDRSVRRVQRARAGGAVGGMGLEPGQGM